MPLKRWRILFSSGGEICLTPASNNADFPVYIANELEKAFVPSAQPVYLVDATILLRLGEIIAICEVPS